MRSSLIQKCLLAAVLGLSTGPLSAQDWDAATRATSWAKQDKDDSFVFFDAAARMLRIWGRDTGTTASISLARLEGMPERWFMDPRNHAWIVQGATLTVFDAAGRVFTSYKLPADVGDVCWDTTGFVLSYRTPEPYLEKRDFVKGDVVWSFGTRPPARRETPLTGPRRTLAVDDGGGLLMADSGTLNLARFDLKTGRRTGDTALTLADSKQPAPPLDSAAVDRGPIAVWSGKNIVFGAMPAAQIPALLRKGLAGLLLARMDLAQQSLELLPTGLDEGHTLVGLLDSDAVFVNPQGGLMLVRIR